MSQHLKNVKILVRFGIKSKDLLKNVWLLHLQDLNEGVIFTYLLKHIIFVLVLLLEY